MPPFPQCNWRNYFHDVAMGSLDPDIVVTYRFEHFIEGVDPVMAEIVARTDQKRLKRASRPRMSISTTATGAR